MDERIMTRGEQNLALLESSIPPEENLYIWCFARDGHLVQTNCPESTADLFEKAFRLFGGWEKALNYIGSNQDVPVLIGSPIGMQWAITVETERKRDLCFVIGPVFFSTPSEEGFGSYLRNQDPPMDVALTVLKFTEHLSSLPVIPFSIFTRYVVMIHNALTDRQIDVSTLFSSTVNDFTFQTKPKEGHDRQKVYQAERALLKMVETGNIDYHDALNLSSSLSSGVNVLSRNPLEQMRLSIIVFTSLVCRSAMAGGLNPEIAYSLGDSYIESALASNDSGELNALAQTMYHDFIYRVHHLRANPNYSPAIQKCCDYIDLSLDRNIRISDLAKLTGYTDYYLSEKFKKETGEPLYLYIRKAKIEHAKILLESSDLSVGQIAERLAFTTPNYFIKCFHEIAGLSPAQYRKRYKEG